MVCVQRTSLLGNFRRNTKGSIAVMFGASAVPIAIAASVALDMANVSDVRSQLQAAADTAVLAAATRLAVNADDSDKEALARTTFDANLSAQLMAELTSTPDVETRNEKCPCHACHDLSHRFGSSRYKEA